MFSDETARNILDELQTVRHCIRKVGCYVHDFQVKFDRDIDLGKVYHAANYINEKYNCKTKVTKTHVLIIDTEGVMAAREMMVEFDRMVEDV
jgi:uncharacterized protein (DUF779 family)